MRIVRVLSVFVFCVGIISHLIPLSAADSEPEVTIMVAAAASLEQCFERELIPLFRERHPAISVEGTFDSSGKLQVQIENGLAADVFMSAAAVQMDALTAKGFIAPDSVVNLLENTIVLIRPAAAASSAVSFADAATAESVAVGLPESVPAGQYAREIFVSLGVWDAVAARASFGTNVTEVLRWVAEGSADLGVVYATDAALTADVVVVCAAPAGSLASRVLYPAGRVQNSAHPEEAGLFLDFLASDAALAVFAQYGFSANGE